MRDSHSLVTAWRWVLESSHSKWEKSVSCLSMEKRKEYYELIGLNNVDLLGELSIYRSDTK